MSGTPWGGDVEVTAFDQNNRRALSTGKLLLIDNQIDQTTATIRLKRCSPTRRAAGRASCQRAAADRDAHAALAIPSSAVQRGPQACSLGVSPQNIAQTRKIEVGRPPAT